MTTDADNRLRAALDEPVGADLLSRLSYASLLTFAGQIPEHQATVAEYSLPARAELDLHLDGTSVHGHETDAEDFGSFVQRVAKSVHATARSGADRQRMKTHLQVVGPAQGSVRVVFRAPEVPDARPTDRSSAFPLQQREPVEALALRTLASLLGQAESDEEGLPAALQGLDARARSALRRVAVTVRDAGWEVSGELKKRGWKTAPLTFSTSAAERMIRATDQQLMEEHVESFYGKVDGWSWSDLKVKFRVSGGKWLRATVLAAPLQQRVAELLRTPDVWVEGTVKVISVSDDNSRNRVRVTRILESIAPRPGQDAMIDASGEQVIS